MDERAQMLREIEEQVGLSRRWLGIERLDQRIMRAMAEVPRHEFVPGFFGSCAYADGPVPIGHGQTVSQPFIVALMTQLLQPQAEDVMLEIGTGSGYQAAVLSRLVAKVYSVEIVAELAAEAAARLQRLGYQNVEVRTADGYDGWRERAPFDGALVAAAVPRVPPPLVEQLRPGGRLVVPLGWPHGTQMLTVVTKTAGGAVDSSRILPVVFVPFTGPRIVDGDAARDGA